MKFDQSCLHSSERWSWQVPNYVEVFFNTSLIHMNALLKTGPARREWTHHALGPSLSSLRRPSDILRRLWIRFYDDALLPADGLDGPMPVIMATSVVLGKPPRSYPEVRNIYCGCDKVFTLAHVGIFGSTHYVVS